MMVITRKATTIRLRVKAAQRRKINSSADCLHTLVSEILTKKNIKSRKGSSVFVSELH